MPWARLKPAPQDLTPGCDDLVSADRLLLGCCPSGGGIEHVAVPPAGSGFGLLHHVHPQAGRVGEAEAALSEGFVGERVADGQCPLRGFGKRRVHVVDLHLEAQAAAREGFGPQGALRYEGAPDLLATMLNGALNALALRLAAPGTKVSRRVWEQAVGGLFEAFSPPAAPGS